MENKTLDKLLEQQKSIQKKIKLEQKKQADKIKKLEDEKALLVGYTVLSEIQNNQALASQINTILDKNIKSKKERTILGLPIIEKQGAEK